MDQTTNNNAIVAPFTCSFTPALPELLLKLNCSIAISTYQANKLVFISPVDENRITQLPRDFAKPMGFEISGDRMILATKDEVHYFENSKELAKHYPNKKDTYDSLFLPRTLFIADKLICTMWL